MSNKKILMLVFGMVAIGAVSSIALQSFAQTRKAEVLSQPIVDTSKENTDQAVDQKDVNGNDLETNDDFKATLNQKEKESINDNDSGAKSEQGENDGGQD